jgi:hypothetical protein
MVMDEQVSLSRLKSANHALVTINRLSSDEEFGRSFVRALEDGDAGAVGELLGSMGVEEVALTQREGETLVNFNLGLVVCVTVTIRVCKQF